jgi:hypothetical protein
MEQGQEQASAVFSLAAGCVVVVRCVCLVSSFCRLPARDEALAIANRR